MQQDAVNPNSNPPVNNYRTYLKKRAPLFGAAAFFGALSTYGNHFAPTSDIPGVRSALEESSDLHVGAFVWEPSRGIVTDLLLGRRILFEGSDPTRPEQGRDIYRSSARVTPEGRVIGVKSSKNLTTTANGDETNLVGNDQVIAFTTLNEEAPASLTFYKLKGESHSAQDSLSTRFQLGLLRYLETGTWRGLGRTDVIVPSFANEDQLTAEFDDKVVRIAYGSFQTALSYDELFSANERLQAPLDFIYREKEPYSWPHFAANAGRSLFGSGPVAWAEGRVFSIWDSLKVAAYSGGMTKRDEGTSPLAHTAPADAANGFDKTVLPNTTWEEPPPPWPPARIVLDDTARQDDGVWRPIEREILPKDAAPLFYRTLLHPDPKRPYAELHLVAMDMRRLELNIGAGYEDPHPDTGPAGSGHLPTDPTITSRVVATFNGAFKAEHGRYGMKAEGRLLVQPVQGAATVRIDRKGSVGFGSWSQANSVDEGPAFRQNLDPLIENGIVNPAERKVWGEPLYGSGVTVERSALCLHESGQVYYGWATEATGASLAQGLKTAGCVFAIHLDMNPGHCAFLFNQIDSVRPLKARGETLDPRMQVNPTRFVRWSPKDFFYVMRRSSMPVHDGIVWKVAPGDGPAPPEMPGIFLGEKALGNLSISIDRIGAKRLKFAIRTGKSERSDRGLDTENQASPPGQPLIAWGLGHKTRGVRTGLTFGTQVTVPLDRSFASLVIEKGELELLPPGVPAREQEGRTVAQLPILARDGQVLPAAKRLGGNRGRSALCIDRDNQLLVARMTHDTSAPLTQTLVDLGCDLVVAADRGSQAPPFVWRQGSGITWEDDAEQSILEGYAATMQPFTHSF